MTDYRLIAKAVEMYDAEKPDCTLEEYVDEYVTEAYKDMELDRYYSDDGCSPYAYQQDMIDLRRFER